MNNPREISPKMAKIIADFDREVEENLADPNTTVAKINDWHDREVNKVTNEINTEYKKSMHRLIWGSCGLIFLVYGAFAPLMGLDNPVLFTSILLALGLACFIAYAILKIRK